ncbi:acyl-CoA N-acyltransferase [Xylogone sp. PMI_703]|nr:acyl-CoA N-acyltransferase [Xylogone sp. PMI_703]
MHLTIYPIQVQDADTLIRKCEFPAIQANPLHLIRFPRSFPEARESEIQWMVNNLKNTLEKDRHNFRKICADDGTPVGFAGWTVVQDEASMNQRHVGNQDQNFNPDPETLDVDAWLEVSKMLREERNRVLYGLKNAWRLITISVNQDYQHQGIGSMLMKWGCEEADRNQRDSFVMASPAAVKLYTKFGFKKAGEVRTEKGVFQSMFRKAQIP